MASTEGAPQSELNPSNVPELDPTNPLVTTSQANGSSTVENAKTTVLSSAQSAMETVQNHPITQNVVDTVNNGKNVKEQADKTRSEFADLANARTTPDQPAATGQPLTHYHSMFYRLLSWKNPRATAITFAASVLLIFAARYLHILRYIFKALYMVLGITASAELAGKAILGNGLTSQVRPRKYFTINKASLERFTDDLEQLINFFVIEFQRIIFAENVYVTVAAFFSALISYGLIKFVPVWGLTLIATCIIYLAPLIYLKNKDFIDAQLEQGREIFNQQAAQIKDIAAQHTGKASETIKSYTGEYSSKAQELINNARGRSTSPESSVKRADFPSAPKSEPVADAELPKPVQPQVELS